MEALVFQALADIDWGITLFVRFISRSWTKAETSQVTKNATEAREPAWGKLSWSTLKMKQRMDVSGIMVQ